MALPTLEAMLQMLRFPLGVLFAVASVWVAVTPVVRMFLRLMRQPGSTPVAAATASAPPAEARRSRAA